MSELLKIILCLLCSVMVSCWGTKILLFGTGSNKEFSFKKIESQDTLYFQNSAKHIGVDSSFNLLYTYSFTKSNKGTLNSTVPCYVRGGYVPWDETDNLVIYNLTSGASLYKFYKLSTSYVYRYMNRSTLFRFRYYENPDNGDGFFLYAYSEIKYPKWVLAGYTPVSMMTNKSSYQDVKGVTIFYDIDVSAYIHPTYGLMVVPVMLRNTTDDGSAKDEMAYYHLYAPTMTSFYGNLTKYVDLARYDLSIRCIKSSLNAYGITTGTRSVQCGQIRFKDGSTQKLRLFCYLLDTSVSNILYEEINYSIDVIDFDLGRFAPGAYFLLRQINPYTSTNQLELYLIIINEQMTYICKRVFDIFDASIKIFHGVAVGSINMIIVGSKEISSSSYEYYYKNKMYELYNTSIGSEPQYSNTPPEGVEQLYYGGGRSNYSQSNDTVGSLELLLPCSDTTQYRMNLATSAPGDITCYSITDLPGYVFKFEFGFIYKCNTSYYVLYENQTSACTKCPGSDGEGNPEPSSSYEFRQDDGTCLTECPNYYFVNSSGKYCIDSCNSSYPFHDYYDHKLCRSQEQCSTGKVYFVDSNTNLKWCLNTCEENNTSYFYAEDPSNECITQCPHLYYYINQLNNSKKCVASCQSTTTYKYISSLNSYMCVTGCSQHYYTDISSNHYCIDKCSDNNVYKYDKNDGSKQCLSNCPNKYYHHEGEYICTNSCEITENYKNNVYRSNECVSNCNDKYNIEYC